MCEPLHCLSKLMEVWTRLRTLLSDERQLARRLISFTYEVGEIRAAAPVPGEELNWRGEPPPRHTRALSRRWRGRGNS